MAGSRAFAFAKPSCVWISYRGFCGAHSRSLTARPALTRKSSKGKVLNDCMNFDMIERLPMKSHRQKYIVLNPDQSIFSSEIFRHPPMVELRSIPKGAKLASVAPTHVTTHHRSATPPLHHPHGTRRWIKWRCIVAQSEPIFFQADPRRHQSNPVIALYVSHPTSSSCQPHTQPLPTATRPTTFLRTHPTVSVQKYCVPHSKETTLGCISTISLLYSPTLSLR